MTLGLNDKRIDNFSSYIGYLKNKIEKFYFSHLIFLMLSLPLSYYFFLHEMKGKMSFVFDLFLIQSWVPNSAVWRSYNGVTWFLSTLLFCYMLIPIAQYLYDRIGGKTQEKKVLILIILQAFIISVMLSFAIHDNVEYWLYAFPPVRLLDFSSGYVLAKIYKGHSSIRTTIMVKAENCTILEVILIMLMVILMFVYPFVDAGFRRQALYFPFSLCLTYVFAVGKGRVSKLLSTRWFVQIGNNSFYYYISHQVIFKWLYKVYQRTTLIESRSFYIDFLLVMLSLIITMVSQKIMECVLSYIRKKKFCWVYKT